MSRNFTTFSQIINSTEKKKGMKWYRYEEGRTRNGALSRPIDERGTV
jgi:hypothetical protein